MFVETKRGADELERFLTRNSQPATSIHGDRSQEQREMVSLALTLGVAYIGSGLYMCSDPVTHMDNVITLLCLVIKQALFVLCTHMCLGRRFLTSAWVGQNVACFSIMTCAA